MFKYRVGIAVILALVLVVGPVFPQDNAVLDLSGRQAVVFDESMLTSLEDFVQTAMEEYGITGTAIAIVQDNGHSIYLGTFGTTGENSDQAVDTQTRFMIGSTTKSMTALLMAQLVDEGLVDWNTPVTDILPQFTLNDPEATAQIRVRDLFNMSSGVPRYDLPRHLFSLSAQDTFYWISHTPIISMPGETWNYSNFMVAAGGWLAATLTGTADDNLEAGFAELMQTRIFDPIGLERTTFDFDAAVADPNHAIPYGYNIVDGELSLVEVPYLLVKSDVVPIAPATGVWASIEDMSKYIAFQMNDGVTVGGERLVSRENLEATRTSEIMIAPGYGYGMGWFVADLYGQPLLTHGGNTLGFTTDMTYLPEGNLGITILTNRDIATNFTDSVASYIIEQAFELEHTSSGLYSQQEAMLSFMIQNMVSGIQPADVTTVDPSYTGTYEFGLTVHIEGDNFLVGTATGDVPVYSSGESGGFVMMSMLGPNLMTFAEAKGVMTMTLTSLLNFDGTPQTITLNKID